MSTLLITGGAGFIGSNLVRHVLETTADVIVVVDKLTYATNRLALEAMRSDRRVAFVQADIADREAMSRVFLQHRPAAILNLAAETHVDRSIDSSWPFVETNVYGTVALLEAARRLLRELQPAERDAFRFLHVSTDEVYGTLGATGHFTEGTAYSPNSPYAASKAAADHLVRAYHHTHGLATLITNCSNNYGPFQYPEKLIPLMILNALDARPLPIYGDGGNVRDWLHVEDHCAAIMLVLTKGRAGESYNIGAANEQSNLALVDRLCDALESIVPAQSNPAMIAAGISTYRGLKRFVTDRPGHDRRYAVDASKIRRDLGWKPERTFAEGLRDTVRWYVEERDSFASARVGYDRERLGLGAAVTTTS
jgi:dTDP-glucose 4,6-dehydratase